MGDRPRVHRLANIADGLSIDYVRADEHNAVVSRLESELGETRDKLDTVGRQLRDALKMAGGTGLEMVVYERDRLRAERNRLQAERDRLKDECDVLNQVSGEVCEECGWAGIRPPDPCAFCEMWFLRARERRAAKAWGEYAESDALPAPRWIELTDELDAWAEEVKLEADDG